METGDCRLEEEKTDEDEDEYARGFLSFLNTSPSRDFDLENEVEADADMAAEWTDRLDAEYLDRWSWSEAIVVLGCERPRNVLDCGEDETGSGEYGDSKGEVRSEALLEQAAAGAGPRTDS